METMERIGDHTHRVTIYSDLQYQRRQCRARNCVMRVVVKGLLAPLTIAELMLRRSIQSGTSGSRSTRVELHPARVSRFKFGLACGELGVGG
jgi:hypothetical protein